MTKITSRFDHGYPTPLRPSRAGMPGLDDLTLPDGRSLREVGGGELAGILIALGVPGVSHEQGRQNNAAAYGAHLQSIADDAGKKAVAAFLNRSAH